MHFSSSLMRVGNGNLSTETVKAVLKDDRVFPAISRCVATVAIFGNCEFSKLVALVTMYEYRSIFNNTLDEYVAKADQL